MKKLVNTILAGALGLSMIADVSAQTGGQDSGSTTVSVTRDTFVNVLTVSITDTRFGFHAYSYDQQEATATISVKVQDNRGTNAGWTVNLNAGGDFQGSNTGESIPLSGLSLGAGTVTGPTPTVGQPASDIIPTALNPVTRDGQPILTAEPGQGAGKYEFEMAGTLVIPAGQVVDTYSTTLTIEVPAAP